jgi:hypothetical protein
MSILAGETYDLQAPPGMQRAAALAGGFDLYGDPYYRMVWGWSRLEMRVGLHNDYDDNDILIRRELRAEWWPRYQPRDRFHLEIKKPAEIYGSPDAWEDGTAQWVGGTKVLALGPFPSRGEYEHVAVCQTQTGEFLWPNETVVRDLITWHRRAIAITKDQRQLLAEAATQSEKEARRKKFHDIIDSEAKAFPFRTWVPVSGKNPRPNPSA